MSLETAAVDIRPTTPSRFRGRRFQRHGWTWGVLALLVVLQVVEIYTDHHYSSFDFLTLAIATLPLGLAAMAQSVILISGGIDLSIGGQMALFNCLSALLMNSHGMGTAILVSIGILVAGAAIGAVTGAATVLTGVPDIVVTLATSFVWGGLALVVLAAPGGGAPLVFQNVGVEASIWQWLPNGILVLAIAYVVVWLPIRRARIGTAMYAIGSNAETADLSGVHVGLTKTLAYALAGVFTAAAGLALTSSTGIGDPNSGALYTLNSVAAAVLGGVSLAGGRGGLIGPVLAAFILSLIVAILVFMGVNSNFSQVIQGGMMVVVVMIGGLMTWRRS